MESCRLKGGMWTLPSLLRTSRVSAAVKLVRNWIRVRKPNWYLLIRNFSRMFRDPEKTPCATATEIPNRRLRNTSMVGGGG